MMMMPSDRDYRAFSLKRSLCSCKQDISRTAERVHAHKTARERKSIAGRRAAGLPVWVRAEGNQPAVAILAFAAINDLISLRQEPQMVPALSARPMASTLVRPCSRIARVRV